MVIQHFSHDHPLTSYKEAEKTSRLDDGSSRNCYGCSGGLLVSSSNKYNNPDDEAYYCCVESECNFFLHKKCAELPQKLQSFFHIAHPLTLLAKAPSIDGGFICGVCEESRSGFTYHCSECQFNIDPECSFKKPNWLTDLGQREIEHFSHRHHLVPYMVPEEVQVKCDGCILPVSGLAYVCSRCCHFHLHTTCIDLEKKKTRHPFHPAHVLNLLAKSQDKDTIKCDACFKLIEGFVYRCDRGDRGNRVDFCGFNLDPICASKVSTVKHEIHRHPLGTFKEIYDARSCNVCGELCREDIHRCVQCDFNVHKSCAATPICIYHDCHSHALELVVPEKNDEGADDEDERCDVCNEKRKVNCAAYVCTRCNFVAHIDCVKDQARIVDKDATSSDEVDGPESTQESTSGDGNTKEEMQGETVEQRVESMLKLLKDLFSKRNQLKKEAESAVEQAERIILVGEPGVGKTWMARKISELAIRRGIVDAVLWIYLYKKYDDNSLLQDIACQLSLVCTGDELEDEDNDDEEEEEEEEDKEELEREKKKEEQEQEKILKQKIRSGLGKRCLLVLDGEERDEMNEKEAMVKLTALIYPNKETSFKVLITRRSRGGSEETGEGVKVLKPLNKEDAFSLLEQRAQKAKLMKLSVSEKETIFKKSNGHPAAIIMTLEALRHITVGAEPIIDGVTDLFRFGFDMLPNNVMKNCNWYSKPLFRKFGAVHQNELISYWIMEGYLGSADCMKTAYAQGHDVLVKLVDRGMLKILEDDVVTMEEGALTVTDDPNHEIGRTANLGLPDVLVKDEWDGLGRVALSVGMIRTRCSQQNWQMISTLLIDGNHLDKSLFSRMTGLQVLAIFKPRFKSLPSSSLSKIKKLRVLVLRGCDLLDDVRDISKLRTLVVLEISGAPCLEQIPDDLFDKMPGLRSLNLSQVQISSLPSQPQKPHELCWLILRGCSKLKTLPRLIRFKKLELLDLSDATSLENVDLSGLYRLHRLFLRGCSNLKTSRLGNFKNLEMLDHSAAASLENIELYGLSSLRQLFLRGCTNLREFPEVRKFKFLEVLDLTDAKSLEVINLHDFINQKNLQVPCNIKQLILRGCSSLKGLPSFERMTKLEVLDLTGATSLEKVELHKLCSLHQLILKACSSLTELPSIEQLTNLEVLDLAGATSLKRIKDYTFSSLQKLHVIDFSATDVEKLPDIHDLGKLNQLILRGCPSLEILPRLPLNIHSVHASDCTRLKELGENFLYSKVGLQILDLSRTAVECLPAASVSSCHSDVQISTLILSGCSGLRELPQTTALIHLEVLDLSDAKNLSKFEDKSLEHLKDLQVLNVSNTKVESLPNLSKLENLRELKLSGCHSLVQLPPMDGLKKLEVLNLSGCRCLRGIDLQSLECMTSLKILDLSETNLEMLPSICNHMRRLVSLSSLEILDLSGTRIKGFTSWISEFIGLESINLPNLKDIDRQVSEPPPEEVKFKNNGTFFLKGNSTARITKIQFPASSLSGKGKQIISSYQDGLNSVICSLERFDFAIEAFLETRGFRSFPEESKSALKGTSFFSFIGSTISCLSDLDANTLMEMKHCWLERCLNMENILCGEGKEAELVGNLEILWASNLPSLRSMYGNVMEINCFKNLKYLSLDCCPKLTKIFSSSQLPQNLETLEIKFCDNLKTLFESEESSDCRLEKLQKLHLFELPELKSIGALFPNLKKENEKIKHCPNLQYNHLLN